MKWIFNKLGIYSKQDAIALFWQIVKFSIVGISNTLIALAIYYILIFFNTDRYLVGNFLGFVISVANAFFWNNRFVFKCKYDSSHKKWHRLWWPLIKSYLAYGITFLISQGLLYAQVEWLGISKMIAPVINLLATIPLNFLLNKLWTFNT